jgi:hypothetical protein
MVCPEKAGLSSQPQPTMTHRSTLSFAGTSLLALTSLGGAVVVIILFGSQTLIASVVVSQVLTLIAVSLAYMISESAH